MAYNYCGQRCGRPHLASWAEAGLTVARGSDGPATHDVRPVAAGLLGRALAAIPAPSGNQRSSGHARVRADAGYFTAELAHRSRGRRRRFHAIAAKRNTAMWRAYAGIDQDHWVAAIDMPGAQVAACDYAPAGWPEGTYTLVRRVAVAADDIRRSPRPAPAHHPADQLKLALGDLDQVHAVSFIVIPIYNTPPICHNTPPASGWVPHRLTCIKEAKHGAALATSLRKPQLNTVWMWAALLAMNTPSPAANPHRRRRPRCRHDPPPRTDQHPRPPYPPTARTLTWRLPPRSRPAPTGPSPASTELPAPT